MWNNPYFRLPRPSRFFSLLVKTRRIVRQLAGELIPGKPLPNDLRERQPKAPVVI